jgi:hypothetical protein
MRTRTPGISKVMSADNETAYLHNCMKNFSHKPGATVERAIEVYISLRELAGCPTSFPKASIEAIARIYINS